MPEESKSSATELECPFCYNQTVVIPAGEPYKNGAAITYPYRCGNAKCGKIFWSFKSPKELSETV